MVGLRVARAQGTSARRAAVVLDFPRTSLRRAAPRFDGMDADPGARDFFDSPAGQLWVHRLVVVLLLVVVVWGSLGVEKVQFILQALGLDRRVACSRSHLQERSQRLQLLVREFGQEEVSRLNLAAVARTIPLCADEMWMARTMVLAANDPVSNYLFAQTIAATRDEATWTQTLQEARAGMTFTIHTVVTDQAKALIALAQNGLDVLHVAELFHGQYELTGATARRLATRVQAAQTAHDEAVAATRAVRGAQHAEAAGERGPGRPRDWDHALAVAQETQHQTALALRQARADQEGMREAVRGLSDALHPIDLTTGQVQAPDTVVAALERHLTRAQGIATKLGTRAVAAVTSVRSMVPAWGALVSAWHEAVAARVAAAKLSAGLAALVLGVLIPALYLDWIRTRNHLVAAERKRLTGLRDELLGTVRTHAEWIALPPAHRAALLGLAQECAQWFVRCTGSTEGHNGWLRLHFNHLHRVTPEWLETQRVLHNFLLRRPDGTTAAQRFFGVAHGDLLESLVARMPLPALPRRRATPKPDDLARLAL